MLCKLMTCAADATERRITVFGTANLCAGHAAVLDGWLHSDGTSDLERHVLGGLGEVFRYGPHEDPPLSESRRGEQYAHPRTGAV